MTATPWGRPRTPLDADAIAAALKRSACRWTSVTVLAVTGSTNADLVAAARAGAAEGAVIVADEQLSGRGRLDRAWTAPACSSLLGSVLLRPAAPVPVGSWGWVPLLVGLGVRDAVRAATGVQAGLKWPNDVVVDGEAWDGSPGPRKLAGVLVERVPGQAALVAGVGLNVDLGRHELPAPAATSLALEAGAASPPRELPAREEVLAAVVVALARRYEAFVAAAGDAERCGLAPDYRRACLTLGREVRAVLPADRALRGTAVGIDSDGALLVESGGRRETVRAGDVLHVRPV